MLIPFSPDVKEEFLIDFTDEETEPSQDAVKFSLDQRCDSRGIIPLSWKLLDNLKIISHFQYSITQEDHGV